MKNKTGILIIAGAVIALSAAIFIFTGPARGFTHPTFPPPTGTVGPMPVINGGTGASTAAGARNNLGAAAAGANSDITSLSPLNGTLQVFGQLKLNNLLTLDVSASAPATCNSSNNGSVYFNSTDNNIYYCNSSVWKVAGGVAPSEPQNLSAVPGGYNSNVISWQQPAVSGDSPITNYLIYRSTSMNPTALYATLGNVLSYTDSAAGTTTYYYRVTARNAVGEGAYSGNLLVTPPGNGKYIFVTNGEYNGALNYLSGADAKCQSEASAAGLQGTYKAWLSDSATNASSRLTHSTAPYVLPNGPIVANSWIGLTSGANLLSPVNRNASGIQVSDYYVWTATNTDGTYRAHWNNTTYDSCQNWTIPVCDIGGVGTGGGYGWSGFSSSSWTYYGDGISCCASLRLYCLQQ